MDLTTHTPKGVDKIKRYGWTVQDAPGELRLLHKNVLRVHPSYQRDLLPNKVSEISAAWSWIAMGALVVGEREGEYWVIDGQHRAAAAKRRSDITHLPCVVFKTTDVTQEARGFLTIQTMRKPVTMVAKQKAMVTAGDETAAFVQAACDELDLQIHPSARTAGQIKCLGWCIKAATANRDVFRQVLAVATQLSVADNIAVPERLLEGLWYLHTRCGDGFRDRRLIARIREKGARMLVSAGNKEAAIHGKGGGAVWANGMLNELNKGLQRKFKFDDPT